MEEYRKKGYLKSEFKMFHLVDEKRDEFSYHYHDFAKILIFLRGNVTYHIEGRTYPLEPYDIVLVQAGEVHKPVIEASCTYERIIIYVSPDFLSSLSDGDNDLRYCFVQANERNSHVIRIPSLKKSRLYQVCLQLYQAFSEEEYAASLYRKILFVEFMIHLNRAAIDNTADFMEMEGSNEKIVEVIRYLNGHLEEDISIDDLAQTFYLSKYYLMHRFKEETGYSIGHYLTLKRLLRARNLIQNGMPVTKACYESGFKNYSTFSRAYKKQFKTPPRYDIMSHALSCACAKESI
ncbi:MAG: AraC family transcriptional regulator [Lachnospiraceae bacterium]|nr:AraC family transcriptional regulator [Lachnospiraceae bacterium]